MYKDNWKLNNLTDKYKSPIVQTIVRQIDIETFFVNNISSLYYIFPLLENLIGEVASDADVESYNQGEIRTPISIIEKNKDLFSRETRKLIEKYFGSSGLRNKVLHYSEGETIKVDKKELYNLLTLILDELDKSLESKYEKDIDLL